MGKKIIPTPLNISPNTKEFKLLPPNLNIPQKKLLIDIHAPSDILDNITTIIARNNNKSKLITIDDIKSYILCQNSLFTQQNTYSAKYSSYNFGEVRLSIFDKNEHIATIYYEEKFQ